MWLTILTTLFMSSLITGQFFNPSFYSGFNTGFGGFAGFNSPLTVSSLTAAASHQTTQARNSATAGGFPGFQSPLDNNPQLQSAFPPLFSMALPALNFNGDESPYCERWAKNGECDVNPTYMNDSCKKACSKTTKKAKPTKIAKKSEEKAKPKKENDVETKKAESIPFYVNPGEAMKKEEEEMKMAMKKEEMPKEEELINEPILDEQPIVEEKIMIEPIKSEPIPVEEPLPSIEPQPEPIIDDVPTEPEIIAEPIPVSTPELIVIPEETTDDAMELDIGYETMTVVREDVTENVIPEQAIEVAEPEQGLELQIKTDEMENKVEELPEPETEPEPTPQQPEEVIKIDELAEGETEPWSESSSEFVSSEDSLSSSISTIYDEPSTETVIMETEAGIYSNDVGDDNNIDDLFPEPQQLPIVEDLVPEDILPENIVPEQMVDAFPAYLNEEAEQEIVPDQLNEETVFPIEEETTPYYDNMSNDMEEEMAIEEMQFPDEQIAEKIIEHKAEALIVEKVPMQIIIAEPIALPAEIPQLSEDAVQFHSEIPIVTPLEVIDNLLENAAEPAPIISVLPDLSVPIASVKASPPGLPTFPLHLSFVSPPLGTGEPSQIQASAPHVIQTPISSSSSESTQANGEFGDFARELAKNLEQEIPKFAALFPHNFEEAISQAANDPAFNYRQQFQSFGGPGQWSTQDQMAQFYAQYPTAQKFDFEDLQGSNNVAQPEIPNFNLFPSFNEGQLGLYDLRNWVPSAGGQGEVPQSSGSKTASPPAIPEGVQQAPIQEHHPHEYKLAGLPSPQQGYYESYQPQYQAQPNVRAPSVPQNYRYPYIRKNRA